MDELGNPLRKEYAELISWSFMADFSEHFVTDVISRFEGAAVKRLPLAGQEESRGNQR